MGDAFDEKARALWDAYCKPAECGELERHEFTLKDTLASALRDADRAGYERGRDEERARVVAWVREVSAPESAYAECADAIEWEMPGGAEHVPAAGEGE